MPAGQANALEHVRVLDLTQVLSGPYATLVLADLGADVIKVEPPDGDQARTALGPSPDGGDTAAFRAVNRNKRSVVLDLKTAVDRERFLSLADTADVVVENYRPGVADRLGVGYDLVAARNPRIIYASISGFGSTGPYADRPGYDLIAQAMTGLISVTGEPGGAPVKCGIPISDLAAGLFCAVGVLAALAARERTGVGQRIETSLYESALALSVWELAELAATGHVPTPLGSAHRLLAPYQAFATADGHIVIAANNQRMWQRLCTALGRPDLVDDPRFTTNSARMAHVDALVDVLSGVLGTDTTEAWTERLLAAGVPAGPIQPYDRVIADEHTRARGMVVDVASGGRALPSLALPLHMSGPAWSIRSGAPALGEHTTDVLGERGRP